MTDIKISAKLLMILLLNIKISKNDSKWLTGTIISSRKCLSDISPCRKKSVFLIWVSRMPL